MFRSKMEVRLERHQNLFRASILLIDEWKVHEFYVASGSRFNLYMTIRVYVRISD